MMALRRRSSSACGVSVPRFSRRWRSDSIDGGMMKMESASGRFAFSFRIPCGSGFTITMACLRRSSASASLRTPL